MVRVGCHVSIAGGIDKSVGRAEELGCDVFQIFSSNPRGWKAKDLDQDSVEGFRKNLAASNIGDVCVHMPYLPNPASPKPDLYQRSKDVMARELERCGALGIPFLIMHPGSHLGSGREGGIKRIAGAVNEAFSRTPAGNVKLLLENTAGTSNEIGGDLRDLADVIDLVDEKERVAVCFDTCHAFAAGYDLRNKDTVNGVVNIIDDTVGIERLLVIHLNDSKGELGGHLDRHEHIGLGKIGEEGFSVVLHHDKLKGLPFILETPVDSRRSDKGNIACVRRLSE